MENILLLIIAGLVLSVGMIVMLSSRKKCDRVCSTWKVFFSLALFVCAIWVSSVAFSLFSNDLTIASNALFVSFASAVLMHLLYFLFAVSLLKRKFLKIIFIVIGSAAAILAGGVLFTSFSEMIGGWVVTPSINELVVNPSEKFIAYAGVIYLFIFTYTLISLICSLRVSERNTKHTLLWICVALALNSILNTIFYVVLPMNGQYEFQWLGPLSVALSMLIIYFGTLRFGLFKSSSQLLQWLAYAVLVIFASLLYIALFYLIFTLIFRGASPSIEILVFNFLMVVIIILLLPSVNRLMDLVKKLIRAGGKDENNAEQ